MITSGNYNKENTTFDNCDFLATSTDTAACTAELVASGDSIQGIQGTNTQYLLTKGLQATSVAEAAAGQGVAVAKTFGTGNLSTGAGAAWTDYYTATLNGFLGSKTANGVLAGGGAMVGDGSSGVDKTFYTTNTVGYTLKTMAGVTKNSYADDVTGSQTATALAALDTNIEDDSVNTYAAVSIRRADDFIKEAAC